ncbi:hypothetical protein SAMN05428944_2342 [Streptomyces sp. 1222.5]|nr:MULTISPECIES: hypothetical protein [unclassified Streptomyces]PKW10465.1 hypothetical protein BX260_5752 [Streptomyces sp. 5112.2]SEC05354.1 hypothetical protein SAMN05428944_2342 [Streptomyces sp. 1222.5]
MVGRVRAVRWGVALGLGAAWWWAVLRLALGEDSGVLEGAVVAGGWGLSVLPVHCAPMGRASGAVSKGRWGAAWRVGDVTRASPHPRSGEVSDPS